ncbi:uncharacterized protein [Parasteatoda tepidariorum]|uniref:uncharacterized protein n=1 Tax=Parasteatoda tepidariorum TaxID=114398 RepID=UPI001C725DD3|nr:uncharacterized protein LOC107456204 [Parasteatoda tepidariorum]XP_015929491.2 uncharacterized protein LOC107456204 [Parasteatoda tepidariorum]
MAFFSLRYRPKYIFLLLFCVGTYVLFSYYFTQEILEPRNGTPNSVISSALKTIPKIDQIHLETGKVPVYNEDILLNADVRKLTRANNHIQYENINPDTNFYLRNKLSEITTNAPTYPPMKPDSQEFLNLWSDNHKDHIFTKALTYPPRKPNSQGYLDRWSDSRKDQILTNAPTYPPVKPDSQEFFDLWSDNRKDRIFTNALIYPAKKPNSLGYLDRWSDSRKDQILSNAPTYPPMQPYSQGFLDVWPNSRKDHISTKTPTTTGQQSNTNGALGSTFETIHENNTYPKTLTTSYQFAKPTKNPAFIIDTQGCRIPKLDPWDPTILQFIEILDPLTCSGRPLFITPDPNGAVHLNVSILEKYYNSSIDDVQCFYAGIGRYYEPSMIREEFVYLTVQKQLEFDRPIDYDHIAVTCNFSNNYTHEQYIPLVRLKDKNEDNASTNPTSLNVILLGIDSVSKLNFFRHFPKTKAFLKDKMNTFDMKGYTKVADNTFPNLVPMLTGHFVDYFWNESMADTFFFDNISLIWKDYSRYGYRTFYAEDKPYDGTFNYFRRGFFEQPTDYYYRPLALMIEVSNLRSEALKYNSTCLNSELEMDFINNYLRNFVKTMDKRPYFAFVMQSTLTHDVLNYASYADAPTVRLLKALHDDGSLNNTLLVIFSDHGIRYGDMRYTYIGKFEERMPFMYMHIPKWFLNQNPDIERNMIINQDRIITLFDIHATLKHLLHLKNQVSLEDSDEFGMSLFNEIPESRTCEDAYILPHWCPCTNFNPVSKNDLVVIKASNELVRHINELLQPHADVCETLELHEIKDALLGLPNELVLKFTGRRGIVENAVIGLGEVPPTLGDYLITLSTQPGGAMFEGTVRYDDEMGFAKVMGVSRINMYGAQSWCIDSPKLKLYCYCKTQLS